MPRTPIPAPARSTAPTAGPAPRPPLRLSLALLTMALMPLPLVIKGFGDPKLPYEYVTIIFPVDLAFVALLTASAAPLARRIRGGLAGPGTVLWTVLAAVMTLAWLVHPSARGLHTVGELWGTAALAGTVAEALETGLGSVVLGALGLVAAVETVWATLQLVTGSSLGLGSFGEDADPFFHFSRTVEAPQGSMVHIYILAGLGLVASGALAWRALSARHPAPWLVGAAVAVAPVGFTFSRAGLVGFLLLVAGFGGGALSPRPTRARHVAAAVALCVGAAMPAAVWSGGWHNRADQTAAARTGAELTTDRTRLDHEAIDQIRANPVSGVGPGRYVPALKARDAVERDPRVRIFKPVHDVPLLAGAEGGLVALGVLVALYALLGWRSLRAGPVAAGLFLAYLPFSLLDHFPYSFPQGLVITALWLGLLDALVTRGVAPEAVAAAGDG